MNGTGVNAWHHVAISVQDIKTMESFFCDKLGFEVDWEDEKRTGEKMDKIVAMSDIDLHIVMIKGFGIRIELLQYRNPQGKNRGPTQQCDYGLIHICLNVKDIHSFYEQLLKEGVKFNCPPQNLRPGVWVTYMKGPEDLTIELAQYDDPQ